MGFAATFLQAFRIIFVYFTRSVLFIYTSPNYLRTPKKCPTIRDKNLLIPARKLAGMIRSKEITCEEVIQSYINRIKEVNTVLNAVAEDRSAAAIKEAKKVDSFLSETNLTVDEIQTKYPLLGLPLTVKESIAVEGCSNTSGAIFSQPRIAEKDAPIVKLCKEAGAIPIAVTTTPEFCLTFETYNNIKGVTNNPYDTRRTCGASSGGEAALMGAAGSLIGLGSDLFGSIRIPANFCGVWGHKPSSYAVPIEGMFPGYARHKLAKSSLAAGPITRYATDLSLLMQVIQSRNLVSPNESKVKIEDVTVYYMEDGGSFLSHSVDKEIITAMRMLFQRLSSKTICIKVKIPQFKKSANYSYPFLFAIALDTDIPMENSHYFTELLKYVIGTSNYTIATIFTKLVQNLSPRIVESYIPSCLQEVEKMKNDFCKILGKNGVLILPTHPTPATFHNKCFGKFDDYHYTGIFNYLGLPVTQCPIGFTSQKLPIGIQVIGGPDNDALTLAVADIIEEELGGWIPPS